MKVWTGGLVMALCWGLLIAQLDEEEETSEDLAEYIVTFYTQSEKDSGTDASVFIKMAGDGTTTGYPLKYTGSGKVFDAGSVDQFNVTFIDYIGPICSVELWVNAGIKADIWKLDKVTILDQKTDDKATFNISSRLGNNAVQYNRTDKADGKWTAWSDWSVCVGSCPTGTYSRSRSCSRPPPSCGGVKCEGETNQTKECPMPDCKTKETTSPAKTSSISIIVPIVVVAFLLIIIIAIVIFKRKKKRREEALANEKKEQHHEPVVSYNKMQKKGDNNYVA